MKPVDILARCDAIDYRIPVDLRGQRRLYEDSVNFGIAIQSINLGKQRGLRRVLRHGEHRGCDPDFFAGMALVANVDPRGGIVSHEYYCQTGARAPGIRANSDPSSDAGPHIARDGAAVEQPRMPGGGGREHIADVGFRGGFAHGRSLCVEATILAGTGPLVMAAGAAYDRIAEASCHG